MGLDRRQNGLVKAISARRGRDVDVASLVSMIRQLRRELAKSEHRRVLESSRWRALRERCLRRSGGRCELCGQDRYLEVHHLTYERAGRERLGDLQVLCRRCHERAHGLGRMVG